MGEGIHRDESKMFLQPRKTQFSGNVSGGEKDVPHEGKVFSGSGHGREEEGVKPLNPDCLTSQQI